MRFPRIVNAILIFILFAGSVFVAVSAHNTLAANMKCPKGKTCYIAKHKETGEIACRFNANFPWQWVLENGKKVSCGEEENPKPSPTRRPPNPTPKPTDKPKTPTSAPTEVPETRTPDPYPKVDKTKETPVITDVITPTKTVICNWCELFLRLVEAQERQADALEVIEKELAQ